MERNGVRRGGRRWFRRLAVLLLVAVTACVVLVLPFRWLDPPTTVFILRDPGAPAFARPWVGMEHISPALPIAVVSAEDQKFPHHRGFDFDAISQALKEDRGSVRGASTITQQLAKNLYLWPGRSLVRKGLEAGFTVLLELLWPKRRILEVYLNVVEFGPGIYGVAAASEVFFGKHPRQLTSREAALLAAVLPSPKRLSAARPSAYVERRVARIRRGVRNLGGPGYLPWSGR
jgi:monofunctional biosynthetic peptidoglycan transglycosylase